MKNRLSDLRACAALIGAAIYEAARWIARAVLKSASVVVRWVIARMASASAILWRTAVGHRGWTLITTLGGAFFAVWLAGTLNGGDSSVGADLTRTPAIEVVAAPEVSVEPGGVENEVVASIEVPDGTEGAAVDAVEVATPPASQDVPPAIVDSERGGGSGAATDGADPEATAPAAAPVASPADEGPQETDAGECTAPGLCVLDVARDLVTRGRATEAMELFLQVISAVEEGELQIADGELRAIRVEVALLRTADAPETFNQLGAQRAMRWLWDAHEKTVDLSLRDELQAALRQLFDDRYHNPGVVKVVNGQAVSRTPIVLDNFDRVDPGDRVLPLWTCGVPTNWLEAWFIVESGDFEILRRGWLNLDPIVPPVPAPVFGDANGEVRKTVSALSTIACVDVENLLLDPFTPDPL